MLVEKIPVDQVRPLLLQQHARLHAQERSQSEDWSYQDEILADVPEGWMRIIPAGEDHSVAWLLWHLTRCEDITMNMLILGDDQVLLKEGWLEGLNVRWCDTGNAMSPQEITDFSQEISMGALLKYRFSVGKHTQEIIKHLQQDDLCRKVNPDDIQRLFDEGAAVEEARSVADYWSRRDVAGLLLMPATRHNLVHLNEAHTIIKKIKKTFIK